MPGVEVLVLHGSPGSGKSTLARAVAEWLRAADRPHAVLDLDDLSLVHPHPGRSFAHANLRAVWPNYAAVPRLKMIIPTVIADVAELARLRAATPGSTLVVCELTAPLPVLTDRVTAREPNEYWQHRLRDFVDLYHGRTDLAAIRDFQVTTHDRPIDETALDIVTKAGWHPDVDNAASRLPDPLALLRDTDWGALRHALGPAADTPGALGRLLDDDIAVRGEALRHIEQAAHHASTIYSATVPVALYIAAILADPRTVTVGAYRRDDAPRPLRAVLLDRLGELAMDVNDGSVSIMERFGTPLAECPEMVDLRAVRPAIFRAVFALVDDPDPGVRDAAGVAAALLSDNIPELVGHQAVLAPMLGVLAERQDRRYRGRAVTVLRSWDEQARRTGARVDPSPDTPF